MEEVHDLADKGFREIQLLGQNVNSYNDRIAGKNFADMLKEVSDVAGISRIRFITSHPNHLTEEMMQVMAERDNICNALHLPPQAGSTKILKAMRRRYTREEYLETVEMLKHYMRNISLSGDIIVGFPGETEEDFQQTLELLHEVRFSSLFSFVYSPRPGTKAEVYGDTVPYQAKVDRLHRLQEVQSAIQLEEHENMIGTIQTVLFDSTSQKREEQIVGRTEGYLVVNAALSVDYIGKLVPMTITDAGPHSLTGQIVPALTNAV
jgi:tRNA-2-methylthio-N6-dimethylallyladenosine synthase